VTVFPDVFLPEALVDEIIAEESETCEVVGKGDPATQIRATLAGHTGLYSLVEPFLSQRRLRILEIGSGNGVQLCYLLKRGLDAVGVEPGEPPFGGRYGRALRLLEANGVHDARARILPAAAEDLPFPKDSFDVVVSAAVIEHVRNVEAAVRESVRVLKPGGVVVLSMPNYDSFYEGHYRIPWVPYLLRRKRAARWYIRAVWRRPEAFLDELNFTTPSWLVKVARSIPEVERTEIYHTSFGILGYIPALHRALSLGLNSKLGRFASLMRRVTLRRIMFEGARAATQFLAIAGMSPVFTIVLHKRGHEAPATQLG
jgi:SAM-dependent methyltransferase